MGQDFGGDFRAGNGGCANGDLLFAADSEHVEGHFFARFTGQFFDHEGVVAGDFILLTAGLDYCKHRVTHLQITCSSERAFVHFS